LVVDLKVPLVLPVLRAFRGIPVLRAHKEILDPKAFRALKA
jgi:hypothetical protein